MAVSKLLPFGERRGNRALRLAARDRAQGSHALGNRRVHEINKEEWIKLRMQRFSTAVQWAGAAKEYRTKRHVTQAEVGMEFGGYTGSRVGQWESGHYFSWDEASYQEYCDMVDRVAGKVGMVVPRRRRA